jgi:hypothetical protein
VTQLMTWWSSLQVFHPVIFSAAFTVVLAVSTHFLRPSVRLRWGRANNSYHQLNAKDGKLAVYAEKHYLQNFGRKAATNVEFVFSFKPDEVSVWEPRDYTRKENPEGNFVIGIPQIAPKELIIIDSIYINKGSADVLSVKCGENVGREVNFIVNRNFGMKFNVTVALFMFLGFIYAISLLIRLLLGIVE